MHEWDIHTGPRGLRLRVCEWGPPSARPVTVVLHGFLEQGAAWDAVARGLPGRRLLAPDQRGHGLSEHIGRGGFYHFWDYVADLDALVQEVGAPIDLVGHSMGGTVACLYAGTRPELVRKLVLVEGLGPPDDVAMTIPRSHRHLDDRRRLVTHRALADLDDGVRRMRRATGIREEVARRLVARVTRPVRVDDPHADPDHPGSLVWTWDPLHRARSPRPFQASIFRRFLSAIEAPTLLVDGAQSPFVIPDRADRQAALPRAHRIVLEGAGHLVHHDRPAELARAVGEHLRG